uniref:Uncharacterized protein TCIL3000_10_5680 n=1 Tax=Trypanosoma congolense (strain IL3000) TaxID=1068625 RepID=G0UWN6_TRYCI|nr:unnamed protein product [Trypanosoma congolense IL3000]
MNSMDDAAIVNHVIGNKNNYYRILFLDRAASNEEIKANYKKMALKCHPDKNKHRNASEAFKLVGTANSVLSDQSKRRIYDSYGADAVRQHETGGGARAAAARRQQYDPNELFEGLFGRTYRMNTEYHFVHEGDIPSSFLIAVPMLAFLLVLMLLQSPLTDLNAYSHPYKQRGSGGGDSVDTFSLTPDPERGHVVERLATVKGARVKYYVKQRWNERAMRGGADVRRMETNVVRQQQESLARRCEAESLSYRARGRKDTPPICSEYEALRKAMRQ